MASIAISSLGGIIITGEEVYDSGTSQTNVVFSYTGSLDMTGQTTSSIGGTWNGIHPSDAYLAINSNNGKNGLKSEELSGPTSFGAGSSYISDSSRSGDYFVIDGYKHNFIIPENYASGAQISGSSTYANNTLAGMGITPGTYTWTLTQSGDTIQMEVVPEPSVFALSGLVGIGVLAIRRIFMI